MNITKLFRIPLFLTLVCCTHPFEPILLSEGSHSSKKKELIQYAREMGSKQIKYAESWNPPGESKDWVMDCSNTVRYTYFRVFNKKMPRTSLDQYFLAKKTGRFVSAPVEDSGKIATEQLVRDLRTGDVLFWENTYNVNRNPPISHVMIYLGKNKDNRMKMFGAGSKGKGEQTDNGGLDVYVFDPNRIMGCVRDESNQCILMSRFLGYARFLD